MNKYPPLIIIWLSIISIVVIVLLIDIGSHRVDFDQSNLKATACDTELFLERTANLEVKAKIRGDRLRFVRNYLNLLTKGNFKTLYDQTFTLQEN